MILEAVYEPIFLDVSHGFRQKRSCHTALKQLRREFNGTRWFVEGDIKGCFDNINHVVLVGLLSNKIKDARITKLIYKFLKAGYLENWQYHKTYSGTPQGGIISPLLANIYLHELDKFVMRLGIRFRAIKQRFSFLCWSAFYLQQSFCGVTHAISMTLQEVTAMRTILFELKKMMYYRKGFPNFLYALPP